MKIKTIIILVIWDYICISIRCCAVYYIWVCMHAIILCLGESHWYARVQELVQACGGEIACGHSYLVLGHRLPIFRTHQLHRWITSRQLHCLYHPCSGLHFHLQISCCQRGKHIAKPLLLFTHKYYLLETHTKC